LIGRQWAIAVALAAVSCGRRGDDVPTRSPDTRPTIEDTRARDATFATRDAPSRDPDKVTSPGTEECRPQAKVDTRCAAEALAPEPTSGTESDPDSEAGSVPCALLTVDLCYENARCRVGSGRPMDSTGSCYRSERPVGCFDRSLNCSAAWTSAVDTGGTCWSLPGSCLPEGFRRATASECPIPIEVCAEVASSPGN
jgi:hypothetical protein